MCILSYWGKRSSSNFANLVKELGEVVFDPYGGSGTFIKAALKSGRRAIYNDINPIAYMAAKYTLSLNKSQLKKTIECIFKYVLDVENFYKETCPSCGASRKVKFRIYSQDVCTAYLECGHVVKCRDIKAKIPIWADTKLSYGDKRFFKARSGLKIADLFTNRNLAVLERLRSAIKCGELAQFILSSILYHSSKMAFIPNSKLKRLTTRNWKPSWAVPAYWLPKQYVEFNPVEILNSNFKRLRSCASSYKEGTVEDVLKGKARVAYLNKDVEQLDIPESCCDIITDPPYLTDIQYGELYYLHAKYLDIDFDEVFKKELVVNPQRNTDHEWYIQTFSKHLEKLYAITKNNAYFIIKNNEKLIDIIQKFFTIKDVQVVSLKTRSRIGQHKDTYHYLIVKTTIHK